MLRDLPDQSIDAVVCDPPYGIDFQQAAWDGTAIRTAATQSTGRRLTDGQALEQWAAVWGAECLRVLKPGGHLAAFGATRTFHRVASGLEDAGLELRDTLMWLYGTGMPKSRRYPEGTSTSLKPAWEPIILARKPVVATVVRNLERFGTGTLQTRACAHEGRYPSNVLLDHAPACTDVACVDECPTKIVDDSAQQAGVPRPANRLFYCPKASRKERSAGCDDLPARPLDLFPQAPGHTATPATATNPHPTVKPITLMRWLVRLTTPPEGLVLDPFCGSGTTGAAAVLERRRFIGIEAESAYVQIARARLGHWSPEEPLHPARPGETSADPFASAAGAAR